MCGVLGIALRERGNLGKVLEPGLGSLEHRGRDAYGYSFIDSKGHIPNPDIRKGTALGCKIRDEDDRKVKGRFAVGQTRYPTSGGNGLTDSQPIVFREGRMEFAICHNGEVNKAKLEFEYPEIGRSPGKTDTYILGLAIQNEYTRIRNIETAVANVLSHTDWAYSIAILFKDGKKQGIIAAQDQFGYAPLHIGQNQHGMFVSSEDVTFQRGILNAPDHFEVRPGEMVILDGKTMEKKQLLEPRPQYCGLQFVYTEEPRSHFHGISIVKGRERLGELLAQSFRPSGDNIYVAPVPESGIPLAYGYSFAANMPIVQAVIRSKGNLSRSYMVSTPEDRIDAIESKLFIVEEEAKGRRLVITDDSIIRGNTTRSVVKRLFDAGALEVYVVSGFPFVISQCFNGQDIHNEELPARAFMDLDKEKLEIRMAEHIGATGVYFAPPELLAQAAGIPKDNFCWSCHTGSYPQPVTFSSPRYSNGS